MRRTFVRGEGAARRAVGFFEATDQHAAQRAQVVELPALLVELVVQALYGVLKADKLEFDVYQTLFH